MQELSLDKQLLVVLNEIYDKRRACAFWFAVISIIIILIGLQWPKTYVSSTTLTRDSAAVVRPLLEGTAFTTSGSEQSEFAREIMYSSRNLETVIEEAGLNLDAAGNQMSDKDIEILKAQLRARIRIGREGNNIIRISYESRNPEVAFLVVSNASRLFIAETTQKKKAGSNEAYQFIETQVAEYKKKLDDINKRMNEFKASNVELQVDTSEGLNSRIGELNESIRRTSLQLKEASIQKESLMDQLVIESQKSTAEKVVNVQQQRLAQLEEQLNTLRLSYTETYPDIIQLKEQIRLLKEMLSTDSEDSASTPESSGPTQSGGVRSDLYESLKRQIAEQETLIKTLEARKDDQERRFNQMIAKTSVVNKLVSRLEELSRDRSVTKEIYDRLLTRRENARVSLNLEMENAGSLFKVQEPPTVPLVPNGLRFLHFAVASVVFGGGIPVGIIIGLLLIDPRIRHEESIDLGPDIPVLGAIPTYRTAREKTLQKWVTAQAVALVFLSLSAIVALSLSRFFEII